MADTREQGSFLTGFTVGMFAGATGYFFFATDKGRKLRTQLAKEWDQARFEMGDGQFSQISLRDIVNSTISLLTQNSVPVIKTPARKHTKGATSTKSKFKGI